MFKKMELIGVPCQGKWIQVDMPYRRTNLHDKQEVPVPKGAVGYCYAAYPNGVIYVGFFRDFKKPPTALPYQLDARQFPLCVSFNLDHIYWLSTEAG